jgi:hypothetical protein
LYSGHPPSKTTISAGVGGVWLVITSRVERSEGRGRALRSYLINGLFKSDSLRRPHTVNTGNSVRSRLSWSDDNELLVQWTISATGSSAMRRKGYLDPRDDISRVRNGSYRGIAAIARVISTRSRRTRRSIGDRKSNNTIGHPPSSRGCRWDD